MKKLAYALVVVVGAAAIAWFALDRVSPGQLDQANGAISNGANSPDHKPGTERDGPADETRVFRRENDYSVTDDGLREVASLTNLEELSLRGCSAVTDDGIATLANLKRLRRVDFGRTGAGDRALSALANMRELEEIDLSLCDNVTDEGIKAIATLPKLRTLVLSGCTQLTDSALTHISTFETLEVLDLSWCSRFTRAGLEKIEALSRLRVLSLAHTPYTDADLLAINLPEPIKLLDVRGMPRRSLDAIVKLRSRYPNCHIRQ
ncbi:MAG: hypothetical protein HS108_14400 [Planctomycetes bacterium]|nr:hypothetical protein [Planctomycetota bacterium]